MTNTSQNAEDQVWYTPFPHDSMNQLRVDFGHEIRETDLRQSSLLGFSNEPWPADLPNPVFRMEFIDPLGMYELPDMFKAKHAVVVSERARNLFAGFDMGATEFVEIPMLEMDNDRPIPGRWFALRVLDRKDGIDLENSDTGVKEYRKPPSRDAVLMHTTNFRGAQGWHLRALHGSAPRGGVAIFRGTHEGADLWLDPLIKREAYFMSDRLYHAVKKAKLKVKSMHFAKAIMTEKEV